jgi:hypothetical protein
VGIEGEAGASARAEAARRRSNASLFQTLRGDPQTTRSWDQGARGERRVGKRLDKLAKHGVIVLHDRRIPGSRANLDHIAIAPSGVWVIDTKYYRGKVEGRVLGLVRREARLYIAGRDRTKLVESALGQAERVRRAVADETVPVSAVLCFTGADWSVPATQFQIRRVLICWPRHLARVLRRHGPIPLCRCEQLAASLAKHFPTML